MYTDTFNHQIHKKICTGVPLYLSTRPNFKIKIPISKIIMCS